MSDITNYLSDMSTATTIQLTIGGVGLVIFIYLPKIKDVVSKLFKKDK